MASIRILLSALLRIVAAALLLITCATPFFLREDVEENREIVSTFEAAAAYAHAHQAARGRLPTGDELRRWGEGQELGWSASSLSIGGEGCGQEGFVAAPGDRFVLSVWRGEWFECFASPSGRHSLPMSVGAYLTGPVGMSLLFYLALALALGWAGWTVGRIPPGCEAGGDS